MNLLGSQLTKAPSQLNSLTEKIQQIADKNCLQTHTHNESWKKRTKSFYLTACHKKQRQFYFWKEKNHDSVLNLNDPKLITFLFYTYHIKNLWYNTVK